jgi:hypothetical protein
VLGFGPKPYTTLGLAFLSFAIHFPVRIYQVLWPAQPRLTRAVLSRALTGEYV